MKNGVDILFLSEEDVEKCITYKDGVGMTEKAFKSIGSGQATEDRSKFLKAGDIYLGWSAGYSQDYIGCDFVYSLIKRKPDVEIGGAYAIGILFDPKTGVPLAVMSASTHMRGVATGAASAIAAKHLAKKNSSTLGLIGAGVMSKGQFLAVREIFNIKKVKVFDISTAARDGFVNEMGNYGAEIVPSGSLRESVKGMDIVILCTTANEPLMKEEWFEPGMLVLKVGTNQELEPKIIVDADKFATDWWEYTMLVRSNELKLLLQQGLVTQSQVKEKKFLHAELSELVVGTKKGRENDSERILYIQLGRGAYLSTCMTFAYRHALELGLGQKLRLM